MMKMDPVEKALTLRKTLIRDEEVLVADFSNTLQGKDTSRVIDLMPNVSTGEYVFRAKVNIKQLDPLAAKEYGTTFFDISEKTEEEIEDFIKVQEFDFPLWFKHNEEFNNVLDYNTPFIMQVAGCNFHNGYETGGCWYCFVDNESNDGIVATGKTFLRPEDAVESIMAAREKIKDVYAEQGLDLNIKVFRTSGGEPTVALDWILNAWREIGDRGLDFVGQLDSNLSTGMIVDRFEKEGVFEKNILEKLAEYPVKILTAIKGVDEENLQNNVQSAATMQTQEYSILKFLRAGFDIYPQMYNPNPMTLYSYLEDMERVIDNFSLRVHIGPLKLYGPNKKRLEFQAKKLGKDPEAFIEETIKQWKSNYEGGCNVIEDYLYHVHGTHYKKEVRSDIELTINDH